MSYSIARRTVAGIGAALVLTCTVGACGGGGSVDKDKLVSKLKTNSDFKGTSDTQVKCIADIAIKYGDKDKINDYIDGKSNGDDIGIKNGSDDAKKANKALEKCMK